MLIQWSPRRKEGSAVVMDVLRVGAGADATGARGTDGSVGGAAAHGAGAPAAPSTSSVGADGSSAEVIARFVEHGTTISARIKPSHAVVDDPEQWPQWTFDAPAKGAISAQGPSDVRFVATPRSERPGKDLEVGRAKNVDLSFDYSAAGGAVRAIDIENCGKQDYVFETLDETKLGQFTGGNSGVRHVTLEVEPGQEAYLSTEEQAFVAWVARVQLESRLVWSTWMWTVLLIALIPLMVIAFLVQ